MPVRRGDRCRRCSRGHRSVRAGPSRRQRRVPATLDRSHPSARHAPDLVARQTTCRRAWCGETRPAWWRQSCARHERTPPPRQSPKPELQPVNARGVQERQPVEHRFLVRLPSRSPSAMRAGERLCRGLRIRHDIVRVEVLAEVGVRDELGVAGRKIGAGRIHPQPVLPGAELDLCDSLPA